MGQMSSKNDYPTIEDMWLSGFYPHPNLCVEPEVIVCENGVYFSSEEALIKYMDEPES